MATISTFTDRHFTIRMAKSELLNCGFTIKDFDGDAFLQFLYKTNAILNRFISEYMDEGLFLTFMESKVNEPDVIFSLFSVSDNIEDDIEEIKEINKKVAMMPITNREEIRFLISSMEELLENVEMDNDNDDDDDDEYDDTDEEIDDEVYLTAMDLIQALKDLKSTTEPDEEVIKEVMDAKAPCSYISLKTKSGKDVSWFYEKVKALNLTDTAVYVFVSNREFKIIIPCDNLLMSHCAEIIALANESNMTMCGSLENIALMEHKKPMTEEMITFIGENEISLQKELFH